MLYILLGLDFFRLSSIILKAYLDETMPSGLSTKRYFYSFCHLILDRMRTFVAFVALCIVASSARTVYDKYRYQSGSSLGGSLGSRGGSYMRSSRMGGSYLGGSMYDTDSPYRTQYRGYSGNLYNNNYDDNFGLGSK